MRIGAYLGIDKKSKVRRILYGTDNTKLPVGVEKYRMIK